MRHLPDLQSGASPPEYAIDAQKVNIIKIDLSSARDKARINIGGSLVWVVDASDNFAECEFFFREEQTDGIPLRLGSKISGVRFSRSAISNTAQPGQWVKILYAADRGEFLGIENPWHKSDKVLPVSFSKSAFASGKGVVPVNESYHQLWNPADSKKFLILEKLLPSPSSIGEFVIYTTVAAITTNVTAIGNRFLGGAAPSAQHRTDDLAAPPVGAVELYRSRNYSGALNLTPVDFTIPPGYGLCTRRDGAGNYSLVTFFWREIDY